jgi:CRISPR-associated endonuclease/helicase Cas3
LWIIFARSEAFVSAKHVIGPLLAKSALRRGQPITVAEHTFDVMNAADVLFGRGQTSLASIWCDFFSIPAERLASFYEHVRLAAFCHDWGKANNGFQDLLTKRGTQLLRHEQVSGLMMCCPAIWTWLEGSQCDLPVILSAVLGHHLKCRDVEFGRPEAEADQCLRFYWREPGFQAFLKSAAPSVKLSTDVPSDVPERCSFGGTSGGIDLDDMLDEARDRLERLDPELRDETPVAVARRRLLWAVRAALIAADSAGSGLVRTNEDIAQWVGQCLQFDGVGASADGRMTGQTIRRLVVEPRMRVSRVTEAQLNAFQKGCDDPAKVPGRALLLAPCGSGKTLAAWRWVAARLDERPRGRAIFLYPTRGTATEGYRDYAGLAGPELAALVHGTADLDLDGIERDVPIERRINEARLFSLRQWPKRVFSATVDQFLGFMQYGYGPVCHLPLLADSVVVLDEVHSYDRGMWSALVEFLKTFPSVPVLCMTATLLPRRVEELAAIGIKVVNGLALDGGDGSRLAAAAKYKRYVVRRVADRAAATAAAEAALGRGETVLWVVNTVDRCQSIARQFAVDPDARRLRRASPVRVLCYHSRYKLVDRNRAHGQVVRWFKRRRNRKRRPVLAVTTQVCEMSLDLDADVLITEECPATALVQRAGRCCRDSHAHEADPPRTGILLIYEAENILPYTKQDMGGAAAVVEQMVAAGRVSQEQLAAMLDGVTPPVELPKACRFTQSGVWAAVGEEQFRDTDDLSRQALHPDDVEKFIGLRDAKRRGNDRPWLADGLLMNLPKKMTQDTPNERGLPDWIKLAQGGTYRPPLGYCGDLAPSFTY